MTNPALPFELFQKLNLSLIGQMMICTSGGHYNYFIEVRPKAITAEEGGRCGQRLYPPQLLWKYIQSDQCLNLILYYHPSWMSFGVAEFKF